MHWRIYTLISSKLQKLMKEIWQLNGKKKIEKFKDKA
jgi:hypothetical protein